MDETILEILECIERSLEKPVLVEGKKDKAALEQLGFIDVTILDGPLYKMVEKIQEKNINSIILLTDLDSEGRKLYSKLKSSFEERGVKVDDELRNLLWKSDLRQVEGLSNYLERKTR